MRTHYIHTCSHVYQRGIWKISRATKCISPAGYKPGISPTIIHVLPLAKNKSIGRFASPMYIDTCTMCNHCLTPATPPQNYNVYTCICMYSTDHAELIFERRVRAILLEKPMCETRARDLEYSNARALELELHSNARLLELDKTSSAKTRGCVRYS